MNFYKVGVKVEPGDIRIGITRYNNKLKQIEPWLA